MQPFGLDEPQVTDNSRREQSTRLRRTMADHVVAAVSPALIMTLVGSLIFFLLEVFYQGGHGARLQFIFAMFVFASVLVSRISMEDGRGYAMFFAAPLGVLTAIAMWRFVEIQGPLAHVSMLVNLVLLAVVWWATDRLTWDCTLIDESQEAAGQGLMQTVGLDRLSGRDALARREPVVESPRSLLSPPPPPPANTWWQRRKQRRRRPRAHGVWVVYFSLAALPLFGVGQSFVKADDTGRRVYVFLLLCVYLASGFGLLVTTSLLELRRYLRQRRLQMSDEMTRGWLLFGGLLIVILMAAVWLLPRGIADFSPTQLPVAFRSPDDLETTKLAPGDDGPNQGDDNRANGQQNNELRDQQNDRVNQQQLAKGSSSANDPHGGGGQSPGDKSSTNNRDGGQASNPAGGRSNSDKSADDKSADDKSADDNSADDDSASGRSNATAQQSRDRATQSGPATGDGSESSETRQSPTAGRQHEQPSPGASPARIASHVAQWMWMLIKWLVFLVLLIAGIFFAWRYRTEIRDAWRRFLAELRLLWQRMFGRNPRPLGADREADRATIQSPQPFAAFADPFASGAAQRWPPEQLVKYSFEAFEAWAFERNCARRLDQTPHEFANRVGLAHAGLMRGARSLADLYCQAAFGSQALSAASIAALQDFWRQLRGDVALA